MKKMFIAFIFLITILLAFSACKSEETKSEKVGNKMVVNLIKGGSKKELEVDLNMHPVVTIDMADGRQMKIVLLPEVAPNTVNNFIDLINKGYYDGLIFHRVINGFMIQGGCPNGTGTGTPGYSIKDEFVMEDGFLLPHLPGVISMAKRQAPHTAGSQFFIVHKDASFLNGSYASFGILADEESMKVVDEIASVKTSPADKPLEDVVMKKLSVDLNGYEPAEVEKVK